jgi:GDP-D-mannose 3',5'-epimerase
MKKVLLVGAAGFLGQHLEYRSKANGHFVVSAGRSYPKYRPTIADEFHIVDIRNTRDVNVLMARHEYDYVYQLAGEVGGLGYIATGDHDAEIMTNSLKINLAVLDAARKTNPGKIFFASSQCVYPDVFDVDPFASERIPEPHHLACKEDDASFNTFPFAQEKLFSEKLYTVYAEDYGLKIAIGRIGNTYGPYCTWDGERAKSVAAICRKVAQNPYAGVVDLWGDARQVRSFTYVDDVIEGMIRLMNAHYMAPVNLSHDEGVTIEELFKCICKVAGKVIGYKSVDGPIGVRHRTSDNSLCKAVLQWQPTTSLYDGLFKTYPWIAQQAGLTRPLETATPK